MIVSLNIQLNGNRMRRNCRNWEQRWKWRSTVSINAFKPPGSLEPSLQRELKGFTASTALNGCEHELSAQICSNIPNHNCKTTARLFVLVQHKLVYTRSTNQINVEFKLSSSKHSICSKTLCEQCLLILENIKTRVFKITTVLVYFPFPGLMNIMS